MKKKKVLTLALTVVMLISLLTVGAAAAESGFTDIAGTSFADAVEALAEAGIVNGMDGDRYSPDETLTRAMAVTVLGRMAKAEQKDTDRFSDVTKGEWYSGYVGWAEENGIVEGVGDGLFEPAREVTGEELDLMLARYAKVAGVYYTASNTSKNALTRGEMAKMVYDVYLLTDDSEQGWKSAPLSFIGESFDVVGGYISWNAKSSKWKAVCPTDFNFTILGGTYDDDGTLTLVDDSTHGHVDGDMPFIQEVFVDALAGWKSAPLSFTGSSFNISNGKISWNEETKQWKAVYPTDFNVTSLGGTYDDDGTLTLVDDSTHGHVDGDMPFIQEVFVNALAGEFTNFKGEGNDSRYASKPGNAEEYSFDQIVALEDSPLKDKKLCILGSSVVYGAASLQNAVGEYFAARFGCVLTKEAVSATTLVDNGEDSYVQRMLNNLDPKAGFDLFICQLSTNDASQQLPLGEISKGKSLDDFDTSTITGAMEYIICYAKQTWDCPVVFFTGSKYDNAEYGAMVARLKELEDKWGIGVLDLWTDAEFNDISDESRQLYMDDDIHPTMAGYRDWWGPELEQQLLDYLAG